MAGAAHRLADLETSDALGALDSDRVDPELELVAGPTGLRAPNHEGIAQLDDLQLQVCSLAGAGAGPALSEGPQVGCDLCHHPRYGLARGRRKAMLRGVSGSAPPEKSDSRLIGTHPRIAAALAGLCSSYSAEVALSGMEACERLTAFGTFATACHKSSCARPLSVALRQFFGYVCRLCWPVSWARH